MSSMSPLDVAVYNFSVIKVVKAGEDLNSDIGESKLVNDVSLLKRSIIHVLQQHLDFADVVIHVMALHHVGVIHISEDLDYSIDLVEYNVLVVSVDHLQGVQPPRQLVEDFVHSVTTAAPIGQRQSYESYLRVS